jgi:uncharacterized membrane protein
MNKTALIISIVLTTFVLVAVGGIAYTIRTTEKVQAAVSDPAGLPVQTVVPALEQALAEREAAYQQMIAEANARLEQAQMERSALEAQLAALQTSGPAAQVQTNLTPEQAATLAATYLGNPNVYSVEGIVFRGENLYKVTFSSGDILYLNMSGQIVGSEAAPQVFAQVAHNGNQERSSEHEDDDDD